MTKLFKKIFVEISGRCNLTCDFCRASATDHRPFMPVELFEKILVQTKNLTERHCLHVLGEPLLHPEFEKILMIAEKNKIQLEITSNGLLLEKYISFFSTLKTLIQLNISVHSLSANIRTEKTFNHLKNLLPSLELLLSQNPKLFINFRFWQKNDLDQKLLSDLLSLFDEKELSQKGKSIRLRPRLLIHFEESFNWPSLDLPILHDNGRCHALSSHFGILSNGIVIPCCLDSQGDIALGNIHDNDILEILKSPRALKMRESFKKKMLSEDLCKRCQYIERFK